MKKNTISGIVITKNEEEKIGGCLESLKKVADEIIVVDTGSTDETDQIAREKGAKVIKATGGFSDWRNKGAKRATGDWLLYIDADERIPPALRKEILEKVNNYAEIALYAIPRKNIILGREMKHGGWWPDYVKRLMRKSAFKKWEGELHENPVVEGKLEHLKNPLVHLKHTKLSEMVEKTNKWSEIEAKLLFESGHPKMSWWRFFRIMFSELWYRLIKLKGFLDGVEGVIYAIYQMWSKFITYGKLWEMQMEKERK
jgi:glycosyltransferase involved in cell wall biosynthesis